MGHDPRPISIWQPAEVDGVPAFVRPAPLPFGDHYADRLVIPEHKAPGTRRVCFFGESVAAGYLYAPHLTPAKVLAGMLAAHHPAYEVIDLARTNETLAGLTATVEQSLQLEPVTIVVFAGNNWNLLETPEVSPYHPAGRQEYAAALADGGYAGPIEVAARRRLERAGAALATIAEIAGSADVRVIVVVPEVNLADWESRQPVPWLPGGATNEWHRSFVAATEALNGADWEAARRHARRMLEIDDGLNPSTFRIFAAAHRALGNDDNARMAAEHEVAADHAAVMCFLGAPRAASMDQEVLRRGARHHGFTVVDMPELFTRHTGSALPGRRMLLDYCHLTAEGMTVAMAGVAGAVVGRSPEDVLATVTPPNVSPSVEATARLGAAVHSAHRLLTVDPRTDIVAHWLRAALDADPGVESAMLDLVAARAATAPEVLTDAQQRNLASPFRLGYQHGWRYGHLDISLIDAIGRVLAEGGRPREETVWPLLGSRALGVAPTDLEPWEPLARFYPEVMTFADLTPRAFTRSPWPRTTFAFVLTDPAQVRVTLTARLPAYPGAEARSAAARLLVNGTPVGTVALNPNWSTHELTVAPRATTRGINRLTIHWPSLPEVGEAALEGAITRLADGIPADLHPVFGEVYSTQARVG